MIPQTIGRYQIRGQLGAGGMGVVYRAYDPNLQREVALKMLLQGQFRHLSDTKQLEILARFRREANIIGSLNHYAIVQVHDFDQENQQPFIVMPLMSGGSLADRLKVGPLPLDEIVWIVSRLAAALDTVHQHGIIHRDIKPGNILFDKKSNSYLADFGVAKLTEESMALSASGDVIGSYAYMSPEQARGVNLDGRSDIYSFGAMLFKMLTGKRPYHQVPLITVLYNHIHEPAPRLDELRIDLSADFQTIIDRAMAKNPDERYATASEMASALNTIVERQRIPIYFEQGKAAYYKGDYDQAIASYNQVIGLNHNHAKAYNNRGLAYANKGNYQEAITNFNKAIDIDPTLAQAHSNRGNLYCEQGNLDQAIASYTEALRLNRNLAEVYNNRGTVYYQKGDLNRAFSDYNNALRFNPSYADAYYNRANVYYDKGDLGQAISDYNQAIRLNPRNASAYHNRGNAHYNRKNYQQALADYSQVLDFAPSYSVAYHNRGLAHYDREYYNAAIADYNEAIRLYPDYMTAYHNRGNAYYKEDNFNRAIDDYNHALRLNTNYARAYLSRGAVYESKGDRARAISDYKKVQELNNDPQVTKLAKENLLRLNPTIAQNNKNSKLISILIIFVIIIFVITSIYLLN